METPIRDNSPEVTLTRKSLRVAKRLGVFGSFLAGLVVSGFLLLTWIQIEDVEHIKASLDSVRPYFTALRLCIFVTVLVYWPHLVRWAGHKKKWSEQQLVQIINKRFQLAIAILFIEVVFVNNGLSYFI